MQVKEGVLKPALQVCSAVSKSVASAICRVSKLARTAASLRSDRRRRGKREANTASVVRCSDISRFCDVALCR